MAETGTIIPVLNNLDEKMVGALSSFTDLMTDKQKKDLANQQALLKFDQQQNALMKQFVLGNIDKKQYKYLKIQNALAKEQYKWVVKKKFFKKFGGFMKDMLKSASKGAGGMLMSILKLLMIGAMFPGLLEMLINIVISIGSMILKMIIKNIPRIIKGIIHIITVVLPDALKKIIVAVFPMLGKAFQDWGKEFKLPWLEKLGNLFANKKAKDGTVKLGYLTEKLIKLADYLPQILIGFVAFLGAIKLTGIILKVISIIHKVRNFLLGKEAEALTETTKKAGKFSKALAKLKDGLLKGAKELFKLSKKAGSALKDGFLKGSKGLFKLSKKVGSALKDGFLKGSKGMVKGAGKGFSFLFKVIKKVLVVIGGALVAFAGALKSFAISLLTNPITWIVLAIVGAFILFYKYGDKILEWLNNVPVWLEENFGVVGKILGQVFDFIMTPIKAIIQLIQDIKGGKGILTSLKKFGLTILKWLLGLLTFIPKLALKFWVWLGGLFLDIVSSAISFISNLGKRIWQGLKNWIHSVWTGIKKTGSEIWEKIKNLPHILWTSMKSWGKWMWKSIQYAISELMDYLSVRLSFSSLGKSKQEIQKMTSIRTLARMKAGANASSDDIAKEEKKLTKLSLNQLQTQINKKKSKAKTKIFGQNKSNTKKKTKSNK